MNRRGLAVIAFMAVCMLLAPTSALAAGTYATGTVGHDASWPNCPAPATTAGAFGIVGVTSGRAFNWNSCLGTEYAWALPNASLYVNLNAPVGSTAQGYISGPRTCSKPVAQLKLCQSYNYGWNTASKAYEHASTTLTKLGWSADTTWWLDVETSNSWLNNLAANAQVVQGAIDFLGAGASSPYGLTDKSLTVGVYSTSGMWRTITGGSPTVPKVTPAVPVWYATGAADPTTAKTHCGSASAGSPDAFTGGDVWLVQYIPDIPVPKIDADYACPVSPAP